MKIKRSAELSEDIHYNNAVLLYSQILNQVTKKRRYLYLSLQRELIWFLYSALIGKITKPSIRFYKNISQWRFDDLLLRDIKLKNNISINELYRVQIDRLTEDKLHKKEIDISDCISLYTTFDIDGFKFFSNKSIKEAGHYIVGSKDSCNDLNINNYCFFILGIKDIITELFFLRNVLRKSLNSKIIIDSIYSAFFSPIFFSLKMQSIVRKSMDKGVNCFVQSDIPTSSGLSGNLWANYYKQYTISYPHGSPLSDFDGLFVADKHLFWGVLYKNNLLNKYEKSDLLMAPIAPLDLYYPSFSSSNFSPRKAVSKIIISSGLLANKDLQIPFDEGHVYSLLMTVIKFCQIKRVTVILKAHKLNDYSEMYNNFESQFSHVKHVKSRWKTEDFNDIDLAISLDPSSGINIQLHAAGIPVFYYTPHIKTRYIESSLILKDVKNWDNLDLMIRKIDEIFNSEKLYNDYQLDSLNIFNKMKL